MSGNELNARIESKSEVTDGLWVLRVTPESQKIPPFVPGQYAELGLPESQLNGSSEGGDKIIRRAYSIASAPSDGKSLEFYIVEVDGGALTPALCKREPGDLIWLGPKIKGKFTLDEIPEGKNLIMVSTGTGIAPFVSMLREYRDRGKWSHFIIVHGARYAADLGYRDELQAAAASDPTVKYLSSVTREPDDSSWDGERGRVGELLKPGKFRQLTGLELDPETCEVFLCGNPEMITSVQEQLAEVGFKKHSRKSPGNLHFERYW